ncbi:MAG: zinc-ribbon domain-containing protein [Desulfovibrionaceae bacterium]|nr:zinc-ribbon domain-containing protein [Desulfovibrionaceae bacterium]
MEVKCPNCSSRFNLPDEMANTGRKLRCSVCRTVFPLDLPATPKETAPEPANKPLDSVHITVNNTSQNEASSLDRLSLQAEIKKHNKSKKKKLSILLGVALFLLCIAGALVWEFVIKGPKSSTLTDSQLAEKVKLLTMRNVRQYIVDNEKVGKVFVIEGKVVNEFPDPKELIGVEAAIYGADKRVIATKKQRCGTQLSLFQLQVLSEKEMEAFLNNKVEILTNNVNVKHGAEVPFMVLFYDPPHDVAEFGVRIVDVRDAPKILP